MVFEWDHRVVRAVVLLEPFKMMHKAKFADQAVFIGAMHNVHVIASADAACGIATCI
jgi:hypothetical protein